MSVKNSLTNEKLGERFDNSFALVNYAIKLARNMVHRGEEFSANPSNEILEMIVDHHDLLEDDSDEDEIDETEAEELETNTRR